MNGKRVLVISSVVAVLLGVGISSVINIPRINANKEYSSGSREDTVKQSILFDELEGVKLAGNTGVKEKMKEIEKMVKDDFGVSKFGYKIAPPPKGSEEPISILSLDMDGKEMHFYVEVIMDE